MTNKEEFIAKIAPVIVAEAKEHGYRFPSAIIAQACLESNYGVSLLSSRYHNYFGMKCGNSWKGASVNLNTKEEYKPNTTTVIKANFRSYATMRDGVKGYFDFISTKRYAPLKSATSAVNYCELIKSCGYATASAYVSSLTTIINKYNLTSYDASATAVATAGATPVTTPVGNGSTNERTFVVGNVYTLTANVNARKSANGAQYNVGELSTNGRKACITKSGKATYKKGTRVTCKDVVVLNGSIWIKTPSCWLCAFSKKANAFYME